MSTSDPTAVSPTDCKDTRELLLALGRGLHAVGQPSHRLEQTLNRAAERLGMSVEVLALPTALLVSFERSDDPASHIVRMKPGAVDLERLGQLTVVADELIRGTLLPAVSARYRIDAVMNAPYRWRQPATVASYVLSAGAFAVFFRGGRNDLLVALCVGLVVGLLAVVMQGPRTANRTFELAAAAAAALVAGVADKVLGSFVDWVPLASGLIMLLPGIGLVDAMEELASGHLASGASRMAGVGVVFLALTFGTVLGATLAHALPGAPIEDVATPLSAWMTIPALLVVAVGSTIRFRARPSDVGLILIASTLALAASRYATAMVGPLAGPFLAALALGTGANIYSQVTRQAAERFTIPGLALLVPGSVGLRSMDALLSHDTAAGIDTAFQMFLIAVALASGLLFSNALLRESTPGS